MTEMIERVAAYLWESGATINPRFWNLLHPDRKDDYRALARNILVMMREPTPEMKLALAAAVFEESGYPSDWLGIDEAAIFAATIDAALAGNAGA